MTKALTCLIFLISGVFAFGQYNPILPPNTFNAPDNPLYWKNKKPHAAYWQQDVHYSIRATLDDKQNRINGVMELEYTNNSPDTLRFLFFHLYQNAFDSGSYASAFKGDTKAQKGEVFQKTRIRNLTVDAMDAEFDLDNTIVKVLPSSPILPGEKVIVECEFYTQFGTKHGRMKMYDAWGNKHFNVVHWYPRISVYDAKFGWTTDQHLGHEFYGDFGAFDVEITLPEHYVLDGTGFLINRDEVLPPALMEKLAIENFANKPWNEPPSVIIPPSDKTKTWKFHAENVHDFAWTADPTYRIGSASAKLESGREVICYALAQEPHAAGWQNAAAYAASIIEVFSSDFGEYAYHKMIVADARDGMEYPMLTLDGGRDPGYRGLLAHEIGHNWFYGMVANNETYRAALDEGFTQFLTAWALIKLDGDSIQVGSSILHNGNRYLRHQRDATVYDGYYFSSLMANKGTELNVHSDHFEDRSQYGQVYYKTAAMLYNLQYVLGDELFLRAMKHYFNQWKFCHPYLNDFRSSIIHFTKVDLNWFFDQWLNTDETIDYGIKHFKQTGRGRYHLKLHRKGMQMPLDVHLIGKNGEKFNYHIPNTYFVKNTQAQILPQWYGWRDFNDTYEVELVPGVEIEQVIIDPTNRLADVYQLDNKSTPPVSVALQDFQWTRPNQAYELEWSPNIWYNGYDGIKTGVQIKGDYARTYHHLDLMLWFNTGAGQQLGMIDLAERDLFNRFNYVLSYSDPLRKIGEGLSYTYKSKWLEGLLANDFYVTKQLTNKKTSVQLGVEGLYRPMNADLNYLLYPNQWVENKWNNFTKVEMVHTYTYSKSSNGRIKSSLRSPFFLSDYSYGFLNLEAVNNNYVAFLNLRTRVFGQFGAGNNWAPESQLYAAGANAEDMMDNPLTRSMGLMPDQLYGFGTTTGSFHSGGGLNLRGYNNYLMPELNSDSLLRFGHFGQSGLAFNAEIEFDDAVRILSKFRRFAELKTYLFADAGVLNINRSSEPFELSNVRMDAGIGAAFEIKRWGRLTDLNPVKIRFDVPAFLNRPPAGEPYLAFRWLLGFERAF